MFHLKLKEVKQNKLFPLQVSLGSVPWKSILTSGPVWGILVAAFASDWGLYVLLICVPLFLLDVMHYQVHTVSGKHPPANSYMDIFL